MTDKILTRRDFLRISALTAAATVAASCGLQSSTTPVTVPTQAATPTSVPPVKEVTLDVMAPYPEYEGPYREIWNLFESSHPGIKINLFSVNEDTIAAHEAKVAGGFLPAFENTDCLEITLNKYTYDQFLNLAEIDFPWFDRWTYDIRNAWTSIYQLPGPRSLDFFQGYTFTWVYREDIIEKSGLDPRKMVKTLDDLKKWLDEGTKWVKTQNEVTRWWNLAWHNGAFGVIFSDFIPSFFPDGQRNFQVDCFMGRKKFNDPDSPYRHVYEFFKEATDKGWVPDNWWTLPWEGDMEASYISGKTAVLAHGPWIWDKALAGNPNIRQKGFPLTPPAEGMKEWVQPALPPSVDQGYAIRAGNEKSAKWEQIKTAFFWFFSPEVVLLRAQAEGRVPLYKLDKPLDLKGPQFQGILKDIGTDVFPNTRFEDGLTGSMMAGPYMKKGAKGVWDFFSNGNNAVYADVMTGKITIQEALDLAQKNWEESYEGLPLNS